MLRIALIWGALVVATSNAPASAAENVATMDDVALIQAYENLLAGVPAEGVDRCGFPLVAELEARGLPVAAFARETAEDEVLVYETPEGHFRVEYRLTGSSAVDPTDDDQSSVPDYVEWVGEAFEESYQREVVELGFAFPTGDRYTIRLVFYSPGMYGLTQPNESVFARSTISVNSDFANFFATPPFDTYLNDDPDGEIRGAIRVTAAHEFKHALQLYNRWLVTNEYLGWLEVDATWMEDNVYDDINDYYNYLDDFSSAFSRPWISLIGNANYDDATWQHFLQERHGVDFMKRLDARRANFFVEPFQFSYEAIAIELEDDWEELWRDYSVAVYLSGSRAFDGLGFEEAARFPTASADTLESLDTIEPIENTLPYWGNQFYEFPNDGQTSGQLSFVFTSPQVEGWTLSVVLQNDDRTVLFPFERTGDGQTFVVEGRDVANFDRIALLIGNSVTGVAGIQQAYTVDFNLDPEVSGDATSFGRFKSRY